MDKGQHPLWWHDLTGQTYSVTEYSRSITIHYSVFTLLYFTLLYFTSLHTCVP